MATELAATTRTARTNHFRPIPRWHRTRLLGLLIAAAILCTLSSAGDARAAIIVPYQSTGYLYQVTPPGGPFVPGDAAFGSNPAGPCPLDPTVVTPWPVNTVIRLQKTFALPLNATNVKVAVAVDNDVNEVRINGNLIGAGVSEGCAVHDNFVFSVANSFLIFGGANLLEVTATDRGLISYLDVEVRADLISCLGSDATIFVRDGKIVGGPDDGNTYAGALRGTSGPDVMVGTAGSDLIKGFAGDDIICGGDGDDRIEGGDGADVIDGEGGNDLIKGQQGNDKLFGGDGNDRIEGGPGNDFLDGDAGSNILNGESGTDTCTNGPTFLSCEIIIP